MTLTVYTALLGGCFSSSLLLTAVPLFGTFCQLSAAWPHTFPNTSFRFKHPAEHVPCWGSGVNQPPERLITLTLQSSHLADMADLTS